MSYWQPRVPVQPVETSVPKCNCLEDASFHRGGCLRYKAKAYSSQNRAWVGLLGPGLFTCRENCLLASLGPPLLVSHQHGRRDGNRRIGPDEDSNHQGEGKAMQDLPAKKVKGQNREEGETRGQNRPAQGLVDASIHHRGKILA